MYPIRLPNRNGRRTVPNDFPEDQRPLLRDWRILHRQIGREISDYGTQDPNIIPLLHRLGQITFSTQDEDFFKPHLCHTRYWPVMVAESPNVAFLNHFHLKMS